MESGVIESQLCSKLLVALSQYALFGGSHGLVWVRCATQHGN